MYYFIVNPKSCSGKGLKIWGSVAQKLQTEQADYQVFFTQRRGHASLLSRELVSRGVPCTIVAVGGDGTANEVIDGLCRCMDEVTQEKPLEEITFGYIPTGSGNDLARGLSLPSSPAAALDAILHPRQIRMVNVGRAQLHDGSHHFIVSSGMGFDAAVCREAERSRIKRLLNRLGLGKLTYLGIALRLLMTMPPCDMTLTLDEQAPVRYQKVFFTAVMNLRYEGGGFAFCPKASIEDDFLDICVIENVPKLKILCLLPTAFFGLHTRFHGIHILRCRQVSIQSEVPVVFHTDGETYGLHTSCRLSLSEKKLPFIVQ